MPIYEYRCRVCGFEKEYLQKLSDPAITDCPSCGKAEMVKLVSAAGFQLKGSGWYVTDFKHGSKPAGGTGKSQGADEAKPESKGESGSGTGEAAPACGTGACGACQ
ncbi:MAG: zinc ribbon domain-containing protein [Burkholderiales bacterium]|nr:zinc ribbon domain-containing protein [Burkholderiales bacterium]